ncbi:MAG: spore cortex-lytic enzyme [Eubacteriales bacterium]|nr:spore cortex-lytic enzyme [Eubacteriales bacterium]
MSAAAKKTVLTVAAIVALNVFFAAWSQYAAADLYKKGSTGATVTEIQTRLKAWGYYTGAVDGTYGSATEKAVKYFQQSNGLTADGQAGSETLAALGLPTGGGSASSGGDGGSSGSGEGDVDLLARLISAEARGEPYEGQVAVGAVVLNRVEHASFPNSISGVIYQSGAFSCLDDGQFDEPVAESAYRAAQDALNGWDPSSGAIYYFNPSTATSSWIWSRPVILTIGKHMFCS